MNDLTTIEDIPLHLRAELDRKTISFRQLLELKVGQVVPLSRPAGENVDLYASEVCIGNGEILVIDGVLAIRLGDIGSAPTALGEKPGMQRDEAQ